MASQEIIIGYLGRFQLEELPEPIQAVVNQDLQQLDKALASGWSLEETIELGGRHVGPLYIALSADRPESVRWLVDHGADLEGSAPSFLTAARFARESILRFLAERGANVDAVERVDGEAFQQALYGNKVQNFAVIEDLGHHARDHGGRAFRSAVGDDDRAAMEFFVANGVDVNYHEPDQVYWDGRTPLGEAAKNGDLDLVKYLVDHGADPTIVTSDGMRPYSLAIEEGHDEVAAYLKSVEPADFHSAANKMQELRALKVPPALIEFLEQDDPRLEFDDEGTECHFIDFFSLADTVAMKFKRTKLLRLSKRVDYYLSLIIVWNASKKCVAGYDEEHEELHNWVKWDKFVLNPVAGVKQYLGR